MKTTTLKTLMLALTLVFSIMQAQAQSLTSVRIDVQGSRYSDQMWVFSVPICTRSFDNGWDAYKMYGVSVAPQVFAIEPDGSYQIDAVPTLNNTYIGFWAGEDTTYTFSFNNENLSLRYQQLYLIDSVANKTIDIFATGTKYTFTAMHTSQPVKRFKIVTSLPTPPVVVDPVVPVDPVVVPNDSVAAPVDPVIPNDSVVSPVDNSKNKKDKKEKKIKVYNSGNTIVVENQGKAKGKLKLYNAITGKKLKDADFNASGTTRISTGLKRGSYVVNAVASTEDDVTTTIVIQ
jgi:hypothetical protein